MLLATKFLFFFNGLPLRALKKKLSFSVALWSFPLPARWDPAWSMDCLIKPVRYSDLLFKFCWTTFSDHRHVIFKVEVQSCVASHVPFCWLSSFSWSLLHSSLVWVLCWRNQGEETMSSITDQDAVENQGPATAAAFRLWRWAQASMRTCRSRERTVLRNTPRRPGTGTRGLDLVDTQEHGFHGRKYRARGRVTCIYGPLPSRSLVPPAVQWESQTLS